MKSTLERINPDDENEKKPGSSLELHLDRYRYAGTHLKPGIIADIACGLGYGSFLLATEFNEKVTGLVAVDNNKEAILHARNHYAHQRIEFIESDAMHYSPSEKFSSIVSLETIEHLPDPSAFIQNISKLLAPGGRCIASVPVTPSMDANPYHLHDFNQKQFRKLFEECGMQEIASMIQVQSFNPFNLRSRGERMQEMRKNIVAYYFKNPGKFLLRLRSLVTDGFRNKYLVSVFEKVQTTITN